MANNSSMLNKRSASIDIVRIIAMLGIILFHHYVTKAPDAFVQLPPGFSNDWLFVDIVNNVDGYVLKSTLLMDFAVDHLGYGGNFVFMLITGYFLFGKPLPFRKRVKKGLDVVFALIFYGILLTFVSFAMLKVVWPHINNALVTPLFTLPNWLSGKNMWYLQAYGLFILIVLPLLKLFENRLTKEIHGSVCIALFSIHLFAYQIYLPNLPLSDNIVFFIMCYYIGGYIQKYGLKPSLKQLVFALILYIIIYFCYAYYWRYTNMTLHAPHEYHHDAVKQPFICTMTFGFLCFAIASKAHVSLGKKTSAILGAISRASIGIYIFHMSVLNYSAIIANWLWWHDWSTKGFFLFSIIDTLLLFAISCVIELLRQRLMAFIHSRRQRKLAPTSQEEPADQAPNTVVSESK